MDTSFASSQRALSQRLVVVAALSVIAILPGLHVLEQRLGLACDDLWWSRLLLRAPLILGALAILALYRWNREGTWPRPAAVLYALLLVSVGWSLLLLHYVVGCGDSHYVSHALTVAMPVAAVLATGGARDLLLIYLVPVLGVAAAVWTLQLPLSPLLELALYPLVATITGAVIAEMLYRGRVTESVALQTLERYARTDALTGLLNRRAIDERLRAEHARCARHGGSYAVIVADLDRFKRVNDTHGHDVGDEVLVCLAERLRCAVRADDVVARWGGEEFLVLLRDESADGARRVAENIRLAVAGSAFPTSAGGIAITISLGVAVSRGEARFDAVVSRADAALYRAKSGGRNQTVVD